MSARRPAPPRRVDFRRKYIAWALDKDELRRRGESHPDYPAAMADLRQANAALASARRRLAAIWDGEAAQMLGRPE